MEGFLHKRSDGKPDQGLSTGNVLARWGRRWFVLTQDDGHLSYYKDPRDATPSGYVEVTNCEIKRLPPEPQPLIERLVAARPSDYIFVVVTGVRILTLAATDETELGQWVGAIALVQQKHQAQMDKRMAALGFHAPQQNRAHAAAPLERLVDTDEAEQEQTPRTSHKKVDERLDRARVANRERHVEKPRAAVELS